MLKRVREHENGPNREKIEARQKTQKDIQENKYKVFLNKKKESELYKIEKRDNINQVRSYREKSQKENYERRLLIRE